MQHPAEQRSKLSVCQHIEKNPLTPQSVPLRGGASQGQEHTVYMLLWQLVAGSLVPLCFSSFLSSTSAVGACVSLKIMVI